MKHTTDSQRSTTLLPCNKTARSTDDLFRAIFDGNGGRAHGHSKNAFDTVAANLDAYGKAHHTNWDYDASVAKQQGNSAARPISKVERRDKREDGKWVRNFVPATVLPCYPVAGNRGEVILAAGSHDSKRFRCEVTDKITGERVEIMCKLTTNTVFIASYGKIVEFRCSSRARGTFLDCRDMKRKPLSFAKSELRRFLGITVGDAEFAELCHFDTPKRDTMSPCDPSTLRPDDTTTGHTVAGQQGGSVNVMTAFERRDSEIAHAASKPAGW